MGHHLGSNCIRLLPAKGRIAGYTELARISQRVMRISSSDPCRFRGTGRYGMSRGSLDHSALMPADLITLAHFSVSAAMCLPKSVGEPPNGVAPRSASRACILGSDRAALIALLRVSITSAGVLLGAQKPPQKLAS